MSKDLYYMGRVYALTPEKNILRWAGGDGVTQYSYGRPAPEGRAEEAEAKLAEAERFRGKMTRPPEAYIIEREGHAFYKGVCLL